MHGSTLKYLVACAEFYRSSHKIA